MGGEGTDRGRGWGLGDDVINGRPLREAAPLKEGPGVGAPWGRVEGLPAVLSLQQGCSYLDRGRLAHLSLAIVYLNRGFLRRLGYLYIFIRFYYKI